MLLSTLIISIDNMNNNNNQPENKKFGPNLHFKTEVASRSFCVFLSSWSTDIPNGLSFVLPQWDVLKAGFRADCKYMMRIKYIINQ
jgi:hypothetical protein